MNLNETMLNNNYYIKSIDLSGDIRKRILELGIIEDTVITPVFRAPFGEPTAFLVRGTVLALRKEESEKINIEPVKNHV